MEHLANVSDEMIAAVIGGIATVVTAVISALVLVFGYFYQRRKEHEFATSKIRQDIYQKYFTNVTNVSRAGYVRGRKDELEGKKPLSKEEYIELKRLEKENTNLVIQNMEITALIAIYAPDDVVKTMSKVICKASSEENLDFYEQLQKNVTEPGLALLALVMRQSISAAKKNTFKRSFFWIGKPASDNKEINEDDIAPLLMY